MKNYPVIKFTLIFIIGILSAQYVNFSLVVSTVILLILFIVLFLKKILRAEIYFKVLSILFIVFIFTFANFYATNSEKKENNFFANLYSEKNIMVFGNVDRIDLKKDDALRFYLTSDSIRSSGFFIKDKIKFLCSVKENSGNKKSNLINIAPGNYVELIGDYYKGKEKRNPGEFDYNKYLNSIGVTGTIYIDRSNDIKVYDSNIDYFSNIIYLVRKTIDEKISELHSGQTAALLRGLLLADRRGIDFETKDQLINAGVIHVLAVSGLHVGYIILIFTLIFGRFNMFVRIALTITGLLIFVFITGAPPSVVRASIMGIVILAAFLTGRSTNIFNSLAIAAIIILLFDSSEIYSPGFQLSFSAVLSIAVFYPMFRNKLNKLFMPEFLKKFLLFCSVSVSAQIGTLPLTLLYFGKVSIIAIFTNLLVIPLIGVIISIGIVTLFLSLIPFVSSVFAASNEFFSNVLFGIVNFSGKLNFSHIDVHQFDWLDLLVFYLFTFIILFFWNKFSSIIPKLLLFVLCTVSIILYSSLTDIELFPENNLTVMMIDVGQGDSFLLKFPDGKTALIDAGNASFNFDNGLNVIQPLLKSFGIKKIDYGFISHMDADHYSGFVSLILSGIIKQIYKPPYDSTSVKDSLFESFAKKEGVQINYYKNEIMDFNNVRVYSLYIPELTEYYNFKGNNNSGVLKIVYGNSSVLFTGDIEKKAEHLYSKYYGNFLKCDLLKCGHHGSNTSTTDEFLDLAKPEECLISAGINNKFKHPSKETLSKLISANIKIYRTDLLSAVILSSDGKHFSEVSWKNNF